MKEKTETVGDSPAFAAGFSEDDEAGLTKQEYFAAAALTGWLANEALVTTAAAESDGKLLTGPVAEYCVNFADALIAELNREGNDYNKN